MRNVPCFSSVCILLGVAGLGRDRGEIARPQGRGFGDEDGRVAEVGEMNIEVTKARRFTSRFEGLR